MPPPPPSFDSGLLAQIQALVGADHAESISRLIVENRCPADAQRLPSAFNPSTPTQLRRSEPAGDTAPMECTAANIERGKRKAPEDCPLYTSDAADEYNPRGHVGGGDDTKTYNS